MTNFYQIRSLHVCMVNIKLKYNFVGTPLRFTIAKLSIHKLGSSSVLIIMHNTELTDRKFAMINLRGVPTKLYFNLNLHQVGKIASTLCIKCIFTVWKFHSHPYRFTRCSFAILNIVRIILIVTGIPERP